MKSTKKVDWKMVSIIYIAIWEKKLRSIQLQNYDFVASSEAEKMYL